MEFEELIKETAAILGAEYSLDEEKKIYTFTMTYDDDVKEQVFVYQDVYEAEEEEVIKKIIALEAYVGKYDNSTDVDFLSKSNEDLFFARAYISEESNRIMVESCVFQDNTSPKDLSLVIDEMAQHNSYLKSEMEL